MSVFLPQRPEFLKAKLSETLEQPRRESGRLCSDSLNDLRSQLRERFGDKEKAGPIILTGHQPIFYHPGILIKDVLADVLARSFGGVALNMVVDTDETELAFDFPYPDRVTPVGSRAVRRHFVLGPSGGMLRELKFERERRQRFIDEIHNYVPRVARLFDAPRASGIAAWLEATCLAGARASLSMEPAVQVREEYEKSVGLAVGTFYASDLVRTEAFEYFTKFIAERRQEFRRAYNAVLARYREEHGIRNPAQPLPDLEPDELPFWSLDGERRLTMRDSDPPGAVVFPKAIALTLFSRLFLCDLFIHGRGGARYDVITDRLLEEFFECAGAPFTVASATLSMQPRAEYPLESRTQAEIERDARSYRFEPTRFLSPTHELAVARRSLIEERAKPGADLRRIHADFMELNEAARPLVADVPGRLEDERVLSVLAAENRAVFLDRTFPFFFYDLAPIFEAVRPYAALSPPPDS